MLILLSDIPMVFSTLADLRDDLDRRFRSLRSFKRGHSTGVQLQKRGLAGGHVDMCGISGRCRHFALFLDRRPGDVYSVRAARVSWVGIG